MNKIADISKWQGNIDWEKARTELDLVIFRASCGSSIDSKFLENVSACGLPFGVYHYVKAGTAEESRVEARFFVECANKAERRPNFWIADIEYESQTETTTEAVCVAFLDELRNLGCQKIGLYINTRYKWAGNAIAMCDIVWVPRYGKNTGDIPGDAYLPKYPCDLWQYTSKGALAGVKGDVDLNILYGDKPLSYFTASTSEPEAEPEEPESERSELNMFTNLQLAAYMLAVYAAKWVYWYGTCGYACTTSLYTRKKKQYPSHYGSSRDSGYKADIAAAAMCADCVGVIKSFFWKGGDLNGTNKYGANNCPDRSANGLFGMCTETGDIKTIPNIPGLVVWRSGHIGVYVGDGYTIEMKGFSYDCVRKKVTEGTWTHWGKLPASMLTYVTDDAASPEPVTYKLGDRTLKSGDEGEDVAELQTALVALGYDLGTYGAGKNGVDGDFGKKTLAAVKDLQEKAGLSATGVFDTATYKALLDAQNPEPAPDDDTPDGGSAPAYVLIIEGDESTLRKAQVEYGGTLASVDCVTVKA